MKIFIALLKDTLKGGLFFMIPLFVLVMILAKIWKSLSGFRQKMTHWMGIQDHLMGIHIGPVLTLFMMLLICLFFGLLLRIPLLKNFRNWIDDQLARMLPGYELYKTSLEQKISGEKVPGSRLPVLIQIHETQQAGVIIEAWPDGKKVVFVPSKPGTTEGQVYIAPETAITYLSKEEADLNKILKHQGKGLSGLLNKGN